MAVTAGISSSLMTHAPRSCCYKCAEKTIAVICHHCGRPVCDRCLKGGRKGSGLKVPKSYEFAGLDLDKSQCGEQPIHCEDCAHVTRSPVTGALIAATGVAVAVIFVAAASSPGLIAVAVMAAAAVAGYGAYRWHRWSPARRTAPVLPVLPSIDKIRLRETLSAKVVLDSQSHYRVSQPKFDGQIEIAWRLSQPERLRLKKYRDRFKLSQQQDIQFNAGFVLLEERLGLTLPVREHAPAKNDCVIPLLGSVSREPFLAGNTGAGFVRQPITIKYSLRDDLEQLVPELPLIRVVPCLVQQSGRKALEIELQWHNPKPRRVDLEECLPNYDQSVQEIEFIEWAVPTSWGSVTKASGLPKNGTLEGQDLQILRWEHEMPEDGAGMHSFSASFEDEIGFDSVIRGRVQMLLRDTISGLRSLRMFYPLGRPLSCQTVTETRLILDFELSLASLRSEELRIMPDQKNSNDGKNTGMVTFEGVAPDHLTIIRLVNELTDQNFYVSGVIDNSPSSGSVADLVNRRWEVIGRLYEGLPTDFHLVMIGDEVLGAGPANGTTDVMLTVRGTYTNARMESEIENAWMKLKSLISVTLAARQNGIPFPRASRPLVTAGQRLERDNLWRQLNQLREALAEGRISEATYIQTTMRIQRELDEAEPEGTSSQSLN